MTDITTPIRQTTPANARELRVRELGLVQYEPTWHAMQALTAARRADTPDEIWMLQHPAVYTLGVAGKAEHRERDDADRDHDADGLDSAAKSESEHGFLSLPWIWRRTPRSPGK